MRTRWIRALLGIGFVATMLIAIIAGQPATAQIDGARSPGVSQAPVAVFSTALPSDTQPHAHARVSGEVVTTLPATGVGPSDPDKRVSHWLFVLGGMSLGLAHLELARRKLVAAKAIANQR